MPAPAEIIRPEKSSKPFVTMRRSMFAEETYGYEYFSSELEERNVPLAFLHLPIHRLTYRHYSRQHEVFSQESFTDNSWQVSLEPFFTPDVINQLRSKGIKEVAHLLNSQIDSYDFILQRLAPPISVLLEQLALGREGYFLEDAFGTHAVAIPPQLESDRQKAVCHALSHPDLSDQERKVIQKAYGFTNGLIQLDQTVGNCFAITKKRVHQAKSRVFSVVSTSENLLGLFIPLEGNSVGKTQCNTIIPWQFIKTFTGLEIEEMIEKFEKDDSVKKAIQQLQTALQRPNQWASDHNSVVLTQAIRIINGPPIPADDFRRPSVA